MTRSFYAATLILTLGAMPLQATASCPTGAWTSVVAPAPQNYTVSVARDLGEGRRYVELAFQGLAGDWPKLWAAYVYDGDCFAQGVILSVNQDGEETFLPLGLVQNGLYSVLASYSETPDPQEIWTRATQALGLSTDQILAAPEATPPTFDFN